MENKKVVSIQSVLAGLLLLAAIGMETLGVSGGLTGMGVGGAFATIAGLLGNLGLLLAAIGMFSYKSRILVPVGVGVKALAALLELDILGLLGWGIVLFAALVCTTRLLPTCKALVEKLWYLPGVAVMGTQLLATVLSIVNLVNHAGSGNADYMVGVAVFRVIACLGAGIECAGLILAFYGMTKRDGGDVGSVNERGYVGMAKHVLLLIFCGSIWNVIWIYKVTNATNNIFGRGYEYRDPVNKVLLCQFVPIYYFYWLYQSCKRVDLMSNARGVASNSAVLCLVLAIFVPIAAPIILQNKLNTIASMG